MKKIILILILLTVNVLAEEIYATFSVEAEKSANLAFSSSGIVNHVRVDVASFVKKGDVLAELNNDDLKASLKIALTALNYAQKEYERQLKVKTLVDESKFDTYIFNYENAKAQVAYQQALLDKTILKAPFDGVIFEKIVEEGDVVSGAMIRTVFKMQSLEKRKLVLEFDQKYHKNVKVGDKFQYKVDGDTTLYEGQISKIYPYASTATRKIKAETEVKDFMVGLFGDGYITSHNEK